LCWWHFVFNWMEWNWSNGMEWNLMEFNGN
jgi:hypothetical protein